MSAGTTALLRRIAVRVAVAAVVVDGLSTVVYGPMSRELPLLVSKITAREGIDTSLVCSPGTDDGCRRLMYGVDYAAAGVDEAGKARPVSDGPDIQRALSDADSLVLVNYDSPVEPGTLQTLLDSCDGDRLDKIVVISKMGIASSEDSDSDGGFWPGTGKGWSLVEAESFIRDECRRRNLHLSVVRAGILKGGGPGDGGFGLDESYYNTLFEFLDASVTMAHDRYTLGADCVPGDVESSANIFQRMQSRSKFEALPTDSNRIVVAGAAVAALITEEPLEFAVRAAAGTSPPSMSEWSEILRSLKAKPREEAAAGRHE